MKVILYLVSEDWYFWSHRKKLAEDTLKAGYEVYLVTRPGAYVERILEMGVHLIPINLTRAIASPVKELKSIHELIRIYKSVAPDLVHHISLKPILAGSIAAWSAGVPRVINTYTGLGYLFITRTWSSVFFNAVIIPILSLLFRRNKYYSTVQNEEDAALLRRKGLIKPGKFSLISGSGVDTVEFPFTPEKPTGIPVVLFASRLLRDKGIYEFIRASRILKARNVTAKFVVAGDIDSGNPSSVCRNELNSWLEDHLIEWIGHREDIQEVIKNASIVCLPSYREGMPKILIEAAAIGRAIVTTDVPGCRDCVVNGESGIIVPARDPSSLADAIQKLIDAPETRLRMGRAGKDIINHGFDMNTVNNQTIQLYNILLDN